MKLSLVILCLIPFLSWSKTFDLSERLGVGGGVGYAFPILQNEFDEFADEDLTYNLHLRYNTTATDALLLNYNHYDFENTNLRSKVYDLMYLARLNEYDKLTPIFGLGAGLADFENIRPYKDNWKFAARARAGLEYALTEDLFASLFVDYQFIGKMPGNGEDEESELDGLPGQEVHALVPQLTLTFFFGPDKEMPEKKATPAAPAAAIVPVVLNTGSEARDADRDGIVDRKDKCPGTSAGNKVNAYGCQPKEAAEVELEVFFPSGSSEITLNSHKSLENLAEFMKEHPQTLVEIQGHTDSTGTKAKNRAISEARAKAVMGYLVEKLGVSPTRLTAYGYGDERPIASNATNEGRQKNRRVIAVISE